MYKIAEFPSVKLKNQYVEAEYKDLKCQDTYFRLQAARTPDERKQCAQDVDSARFSFFTRWAKVHLPKPNFSPLKPVDDIA